MENKHREKKNIEFIAEITSSPLHCYFSIFCFWIKCKELGVNYGIENSFLRLKIDFLISSGRSAIQEEKKKKRQKTIISNGKQEKDIALSAEQQTKVIFMPRHIASIK